MTNDEQRAQDEYVCRESGRKWVDFSPGCQMQLLRRCQVTGSWSMLIRAEKGCVLPAHKHYGAGEYYMLKGRMEYGSGIVVEPGDYGYEKYGSLHLTTRFHEDSLLFFSHVGSLTFLDEEGNTAGFIEDFLDGAEAEA